MIKKYKKNLKVKKVKNNIKLKGGEPSTLDRNDLRQLRLKQRNEATAQRKEKLKKEIYDVNKEFKDKVNARQIEEAKTAFYEKIRMNIDNQFLEEKAKEMARRRVRVMSSSPSQVVMEQRPSKSPSPSK